MHRASAVVRRAIARVTPGKSSSSSSTMLTQQRQKTRAHASVAVVGGGLAGAACACELKRLGIERVVVFDGGRALGGRASARGASDGARWDHGARFIERDSGDDASAWNAYVDEGLAKGYFKPWMNGAFGAIDARTGRFVEELKSTGDRLVGDLGFGATCEAATKDAGVDVFTSARVVGFDIDDSDDTQGCFSVRYKSAVPGDGDDAKTSSGYRVVVLADKNLASERVIRAYGERPPIESLNVPDIARAMQGVDSRPVLALMVTLNREAQVPFVGADVDGCEALTWIANESSKPGRVRDTHCWVAHSTDAYAASVLSRAAMDTRVGTAAHEDWLTDATSRMSEALLDVLRAGEAANTTGSESTDDRLPLEITYSRAHRWGAAFPTSIAKGAESKQYLQSGDVYAVGDWCAEPNARGAVTSGLAAAAAIAQALNARAKL